MSFGKDKKDEPDPMLQAQLESLKQDQEDKRAALKDMKEQQKMAEALAPAVQALAQAQQEQMGQVGGQGAVQNPYSLASSQMPNQVCSGSPVSLNSNVGSAATSKPATTSLASVGSTGSIGRVA